MNNNNQQKKQQQQQTKQKQKKQIKSFLSNISYLKQNKLKNKKK